MNSRRCDSVLDAVLVASEDALIVVDAQGRVTETNLPLEHLTGWSRAQLIGSPLDEHLHPVVGAAVRCADAACSAHLDPTGEGDVPNVTLSCRGGERVCVDVRAARVMDGETVTGAALTVRVVAREESAPTLVKEAAILRADRRRLSELERVKSEFLNLAAHELRGPLGVARGYVSMLADGTYGPQSSVDFRAAAPVLTEKLSEMSSLVDEMLTTAELEEGHLQLRPAPLDLRQVVYDALRTMGPRAQHHRLLAVWSEGDLCVVGDRARLRTILTNLIDNACKYSQPGSTVEIACWNTGDWLGVDVRDEGFGIGEEHLPTVFTRFGRVVTSDNSHIPGTGLGLYLSRELALMHKGDLTVKSALHVGSTFRLKLPTGRQVPQTGAVA